jgi:hypothetical protein
VQLRHFLSLRAYLMGHLVQLVASLHFRLTSHLDVAASRVTPPKHVKHFSG